MSLIITVTVLFLFIMVMIFGATLAASVLRAYRGN